MFKKILYVILTIAFLIGTHLIAQEQNKDQVPVPKRQRQQGKMER